MMTWCKRTFTENALNAGEVDEIDKAFRQKMMEQLYKGTDLSGSGLLLTADLTTKTSTLYLTPSASQIFPTFSEEFGFSPTEPPSEYDGFWLCGGE